MFITLIFHGFIKKIFILISINLDTPIEELKSLLTKKGWLLSGEEIQDVESPGEGNMNVVLRITTNMTSFVLKQSRPYVQKYQNIEAPLNRITVEYLFYKQVDHASMKNHVPKVLDFDAHDYLLKLEDLGRVEDLTSIYDTREISETDFYDLLDVVAQIHKSKITANFPSNMKMRKLNHQHIFILPFQQDNGFSLDDIQPGLQELSLQYKNDNALKNKIDKIGNAYLSEGSTLLHGDYYPGSWMQTKNTIYVLDPEFAFVGFPEYDLGVMSAHLILATHNLIYLDKIKNEYDGEINYGIMQQMAGIEIMRRIIGLAQLPLQRTLDEKKKLLQIAYNLIQS